MIRYYRTGILFITLFVINVYAQERHPDVIINIKPVYENWHISDNPSFSEFTNIVSLYYTPARNTDAGLVSRYASVSGDIDKLNGFSDMQLFVNHRLEKYNVVLKSGLNIPTGKTKLTPEEFITSRIIGQNMFNLRTNNFGQGFNLLFGATWLYPLSPKFVIGTGISYQIKTKYKPLKETDLTYQPSNEFSATAGFDVRLSNASTITTDLTAIFYGSDKADGVKVLSAGSRLIFSSLYRQYFGYDFLSGMILYRYSAADKFVDVNALAENEKINPNQFYLGAAYNQRLSQQFRLQYGTGVSIYQKTALIYSGYTFIELSLAPEYRITELIALPALLKYMTGSSSGKPGIQNFQASIGISIGIEQ